MHRLIVLLLALVLSGSVAEARGFRSHSPRSSTYRPKTQHVRSYVKKNGRYVNGYQRSRPLGK